jgi:hypothetical protein
MKKQIPPRSFFVYGGAVLLLLLAGALFVEPQTAAAATVYLNEGSQLNENSPPPAQKIPVLFVHGHDLDPDPNNPNYQKNWWHSLGDLPSFKQTLDLPENACLGIEPYYIYFQDQGHSIALDAAEIGEAINSILARHQQLDPNNSDLKIAIIGYSKGTLSSRKYLKDRHDNDQDIPVSEFIAIAPPNHGLNVPLLPTASLAAKQLNNGYTATFCLPYEQEAQDFIFNLNGHPIEDTRADNYDPTSNYPDEAPGSRPPGSPPQDGVLYVTLYASENGDFVGGETPSDDCQGRVLAKNLAADAVNIELTDIAGNNDIDVHRNTVHTPKTIFKALYTAVYHEPPPEDMTFDAPTDNIPIIPPPAEQPPETTVVLLFDISGSMNWGHDGSFNVAEPFKRIAMAKQAAIPFLWMLNYFNPCGANFGLAGFPRQPLQGCAGQIITDLTVVQQIPIDTAIQTTIPGLTTGGNTPLLAGIDTAVDLIGNADRKALILLSDGFQNCPPISGMDDPQVAERIQALNANLIKVHAIGFGQPAEVPHDLLNQIGIETTGAFYDVTDAPNFNPDAWDPGNDLQETYKSILVDTLQLEAAADPTGVINKGEIHVHDLHIRTHDKKIIIYLSWVAFQRKRLLLTVNTSDGQDLQLTHPPPGVRVMDGDTFQLIALDSLFLRQPGKVGPTPWQINIALPGPSGGGQEKYQYSVITQSDLKMKIGFDRKAYQTGDAIGLNASISEGSQPLKGLADIRIQITRPQEGIGNWFAEHPIAVAALNQVPEKHDQENLSILHRKAIFLTKNRKIPLPQRTPPEIVQLYDDQTHGDAKAGDGVYTARFSDTLKQGTYVFYVQAAGTTSAGMPFKREKVVEKYVSVKVDAPFIVVDAVRLPAVDRNFDAYEIRVTPKDALGNYLGPGHSGSIHLKTSNGKWAESLQDHLDGTYKQILSIPKNVKPQAVNLSLNFNDAALNFRLADKLFEFDSQSPLQKWFLVIILLLLMVALVALWLKGK